MKKQFLLLAAYFVMLPAILSAQPQLKENIDEIKAKIQAFSASIATIKSNTDGIGGMVKAAQSKSEIFSPEFLSGESFELFKEGITTFKDKIVVEAAAMKRFRGPDLKCSPGSECFKFKKDITDVITAIDNLKKALIDAKIDLNFTDKLNEIILQSPGFGLYPVHKAIGPWVSLLGKNLNEIAKNVTMLTAYAKETGTGPEIIFKGNGPRYYDKESFMLHYGTTHSITDSYIEGFEFQEVYNGSQTAGYIYPYNNAIDTNIITIELSKFCSKERDILGTILTRTRDLLKVVALIAKMGGEQDGVDVEVGGSLVGHAAVSKKVAPDKLLCVTIEGLTDLVDRLLEDVGDNLDKCDALRTQKMISDNQKIIMQNQKLLFDLVSNK